MFFRKKRFVLGMDFQAQGITYCLFDTTLKTTTVNFYQANDNLQALKYIRANIDKYYYTVYATLAENHLINKTIALPVSLKKKDIYRYLCTNAESHFAHCADDINIDFDIIDQDQQQQQLRIAACKKSLANQLQQQCKAAGFKLIHLEMHSLSIARANAFADSLSITENKQAACVGAAIKGVS